MPLFARRYGDAKKYLEPMRTPWEGAEGLVYNLLCDAAELEGGGFYLDRLPQVKHLAGAFFSKGSFTQNTDAEVDAMMAHLEAWSSEGTRPALPMGGSAEEAAAAEAAAARLVPLKASTKEIELESFMGRW